MASLRYAITIELNLQPMQSMQISAENAAAPPSSTSPGMSREEVLKLIEEKEKIESEIKSLLEILVRAFPPTMSQPDAAPTPSDFIRDIAAADLAAGKVQRVITRFPQIGRAHV